jgi:hypothetical protein
VERLLAWQGILLDNAYIPLHKIKLIAHVDAHGNLIQYGEKIGGIVYDSKVVPLKRPS